VARIAVLFANVPPPSHVNAVHQQRGVGHTSLDVAELAGREDDGHRSGRRREDTRSQQRRQALT